MDYIKNAIRDVPDFPKKGILFRDITTAIKDKDVMKRMIDEIVEAFKDEKLYLALAIWKDASNLLFICYGQNPKLGEFLEEKVRWFKKGQTVRSTQSLSLSALIFKYDFKLLAVNKTKQELINLLKLKNRNFAKLAGNNIISLNEFKTIKEKRQSKMCLEKM